MKRPCVIRFSRILSGGSGEAFFEGMDRGQSTLLPECLEDWVGEENLVRVIDVCVDELDLGGLGFYGVDPKVTGRASHDPTVLLKLSGSRPQVDCRLSQGQWPGHPQGLRPVRRALPHA